MSLVVERYDSTRGDTVGYPVPRAEKASAKISRIRYDARMGVVEDLRSARLAAGLSQGAVAEAIGTTQSAIARLESGGASPRLSTLTVYSNAVGCTVAVVHENAVATATSTLAERLLADDADGCLRALIQLHDDLLRTGRAIQPQWWTEPVSCGDRRWDAAIAATVEWAATKLGAAVPGWTAAPSRRLDGLWFPLADVLGRPLSSGLLAFLLTASPAPFAARGIFLDAATFESC